MWYGEVEGTGIVTLDPRFNACFAGHVRVERLWTGARWAEGPAWFAAGRYLIWSDIPNNRMMRLTDPGDQVSVFRERSNNSNGNTVDNQGRLVTCEHLTRRVTRTEIDGSITVLADKWQGKRLNSPNDAVVKSDNSIWFTDPAYGIDTDYEGDRQKQEIDGCHVYRIDPKSGAVDRVVSDMVRPNGIAFSPDEKLLYIADTGATHVPDGPRHIRRFTLGGERKEPEGGRGVRRIDLRSLRRLPDRLEGPHLDEHGGRRPLLRQGRHADRQDSDPGDGGERHVRRRQAQPALHLRDDVALFHLSDHQRLQARLTCGPARSSRSAFANCSAGDLCARSSASCCRCSA